MRKVIVSGTGKAITGSTGAHYIVDGTLPSGYRQLTGIVLDGDCYFATGIKLRGSDTVRVAFSVTKACNILGCYTTAEATNNYSLYVSTTSGSKYLRYGSGTYNSYIATNTRYDVVITPTGSDGMRQDSTWSAATFEATNEMLIGTTSMNATSAKWTGNQYGDIIVDGRLWLTPVEVTATGEIGFYDHMTDTFRPNLGTGTPAALGYA